MRDELLDIFLSECRDLLEAAFKSLETLTASPTDRQAFDGLFRSIHTLKGSAGLVDFQPMERVFHLAEDRLAAARDDATPTDPALTGGLRELLWATEGWLQALDESGLLPELDPAQLERLSLAVALAPEDGAREGSLKAQPRSVGDRDWFDALLVKAPRDRPLVGFRYVPAPDSYFTGADPVAIAGRVPELVALEIAAAAPFSGLAGYDPFSCNLELTGLSTAPPAAVREAFRLASDQVEYLEAAARGAAAATPAAATRTLRVDGVRVDRLANAMDELVVAKNALAHLTANLASAADPATARALSAAQADLDRRVASLHDSVTRLRLVPIGAMLRRFPRLVAETAEQLGKSVELRLSGEDVEVDKAIADGLFEPMLHLLRNAVDHGVEMPDARRAAGKPETAILRVSARSVGDTVQITVEDDGRGLDLARIREVAAARGLGTAEALADLGDSEIAQLVFAPGFSTARVVSDISGRGVGLDAVRGAVTALGGQVAVESEFGKGARMRLSLPVQVRLARLMLVEAAGESYGLPLEQVIETLRLSSSRLTPVRDGFAMVWRERAIPVLNLADLLEAGGRVSGAAWPADLNLMVVRAGEEFAAVAVDGFGARLEAPLRPLPGMLSRLPGAAGATLLGDGRVLVVLDVGEMIG